MVINLEGSRGHTHLVGQVWTVARQAFNSLTAGGTEDRIFASRQIGQGHSGLHPDSGAFLQSDAGTLVLHLADYRGDTIGIYDFAPVDEGRQVLVDLDDGLSHAFAGLVDVKQVVGRSKIGDFLVQILDQHLLSNGQIHLGVFRVLVTQGGHNYAYRTNE